MTTWTTIAAAKADATTHGTVLNGLAKELAGKEPEVIVIGTITTAGSGPRKYAMALTSDSVVHFQELPLMMKVGQTVPREHPHPVTMQQYDDGTTALVIGGCGEASWVMSQDSAQVIATALQDGQAPEPVTADATATAAQQQIAFKSDVRATRKKILLVMGVALVLLFAWAFLTGCSSQSTEEKALQACIAADTAAQASGDQTYNDIRPTNPEWPDLDSVTVTIYDTGVYDLTGSASGVKWSCLWSEKAETRFGWGS